MRSGILAFLGLAILATWLWVLAPTEAGSAPAPQKAAPVEPGSVYRNGTYSVLLTDRPCLDEDFRMELESEGLRSSRQDLAPTPAAGRKTWRVTR